jgi:hypothetical protein
MPRSESARTCRALLWSRAVLPSRSDACGVDAAWEAGVRQYGVREPPLEPPPAQLLMAGVLVL